MPWRQVADQWLHWGGLAQHNLASAASVWSWCNVFASCNRLTVSCKPASKVKVANYISLLTLKSFPRSSVLFFPSALRVLLTSATQGWQVVEMAFWQENYPFIKVKIMPFASLALCTCLFIGICLGNFQDVYNTRVCKMVEWMDQLEMSIGKVNSSSNNSRHSICF